MRQPDHEARTADAQGVRCHGRTEARNGLPEGLYGTRIQALAGLPRTGEPNLRASGRAENLEEDGAAAAGSLRDHVDRGVQHILELGRVPPPRSNGLPGYDEGDLVLTVFVRELTAELPKVDGLPALRRKSSLLEQVALRDLAPFEHAKRGLDRALQPSAGILGNCPIERFEPVAQFGQKLLLALRQHEDAVADALRGLGTAAMHRVHARAPTHHEHFPVATRRLRQHELTGFANIGKGDVGVRWTHETSGDGPAASEANEPGTAMASTTKPPTLEVRAKGESPAATGSA